MENPHKSSEQSVKWKVHNYMMRLRSYKSVMKFLKVVQEELKILDVNI